VEQFHQKWEMSPRGWEEKVVEVERLEEVYDYDA
jgi:hypothetical protein